MSRAFGKLDLTSEPPLRGFELYFGITSPVGFEAWRSRYPSVQNLLDHLSRYSRSEASRRTYLNLLQLFCEKTGHNPDQLVTLSLDTINDLIQNHIDELARQDYSKSYVNTVNKRLKTFFRSNNIKPETRSYYQPSRYRKRPEYIPTKQEIYKIADAADNQRDRAIILCLWSSGLRISTFCALTIGDIKEELENNEPIIRLPVYPEMKKRVPDACKGLVPYYCFISTEAQTALRVYLNEREEYYGTLEPQQPLFCSAWNLWTRNQRPMKPIGRRGVGVLLKKSARLAEISRWDQISPHCLRKAFESVLRSPSVDGGRMDKGTQEFFMGHILPGTQDTYYDKTNIDYHRDEYAKLDFRRTVAIPQAVDKLINLEDLETYLEDGWMFVSKIADDRVVIRRQ